MLSDKSSFENRGLRDKLISHDHFRMVMWFGKSYIRSYSDVIDIDLSHSLHVFTVCDC